MGTATDAPLLRGFNAGEDVPGGQGVTFRWSSGSSTITLQDVGRQDFDVTLSLSGSRPPGQPAPSIEVTAGSRQVRQKCDCGLITSNLDLGAPQQKFQ